jgi:release factor glutamine methyltransferase
MVSLKFVKPLMNRTLRPIVKAYLTKERKYSYKGLQLIVLKGVFHPGLFFSTRILLNYLQQFNLDGNSLLELGAGTGLISIYAAKQKAFATASDISELSIINIKRNAEANKVEVRIIHSNLFEKIACSKFDFVVINPPYYKREPKTDDEFAWYCGEHSEYFVKLFNQLEEYIHEQSKIIMVLSDECDIEEIKSLAKKNEFEMVMKKKYFRFWETNFVFEFFKK